LNGVGKWVSIGVDDHIRGAMEVTGLVFDRGFRGVNAAGIPRYSTVADTRGPCGAYGRPCAPTRKGLSIPLKFFRAGGGNGRGIKQNPGGAVSGEYRLMCS